MDPRGIEPLSTPCHGVVLPVYYGPGVSPDYKSIQIKFPARKCKHTVIPNSFRDPIMKLKEMLKQVQYDKIIYFDSKRELIRFLGFQVVYYRVNLSAKT